MKQIIYIIIILFSYCRIYSQEINYAESVKEIYKSATRDFTDLFYEELGIKERAYYSCPDSLYSNGCVLKRKLIYNENGKIVSDSSIIDTLYSLTNRIYLNRKIVIIKTHPEPSIFKYKYKTLIDSLIIDSLQRPVKYYEQGVLSRKWSYDNAGRLKNIIDKPDNLNFNINTTYNYLTDTIITKKISRSLSEFDTSYNYLIFDSKKRLILDVTKGHSVKYKNNSYQVFLDSIVESKIIPETIDTEYKYLNDSVIVVNSLSLRHVVIMDSNKQIKSMRTFMNDTTVLGDLYYIRNKERIEKKSYQDGKLVRTEIQELRPNGYIKCKTIYSMDRKQFERECYSEKGLILQKITIYVMILKRI